MRRPRRSRIAFGLALALSVPITAAFTAPPTATAATTLPTGFSEQVVLSGLNHPTKLVFSPDGRVFVAEKGGTIKVFDSLSDPTPTVFADLSGRVHDNEDKGLLGLALPPNFPSNPSVYVSYTWTQPIGGGLDLGDTCPTPGTGCIVSGRLSKLTANGDTWTGTEQVLINDWCQQFETHNVGDVAFGPDGALYMSGGEGASPVFTDWGQQGNPVNPCGDPPGGAGAALSPPTAEGGALRSQDIRTTGDPTGLSGTIIRIDPNTGAAKTDNPMYNATTDPNARRIVAYGLRNPYRWTFKPGTNEIWIGDVGWRTWEEINRLPNPLATPLTNFGWPCYEGNSQQPGYRDAGLALCQSLYSNNTSTGPVYTYGHHQQVNTNDGCPTGGSSPTGVAFYPTSGGTYPAAYRGALFWADYARNCIYAMKPTNGTPDPAKIETFAPGAAGPVDLEIGPGGDVYYVDIDGGTVRRINYNAGNQPPVAVIGADKTSGAPPLAVQFTAAGTSDPNAGDVLTYQWDFTGDGTWDAVGTTASYTYTTAGTYQAKLRVTDAGGLSDTKTLQIMVGTSAPVPVIDTPAAGLTWATNDTVTFTGHATDAQDGNIPAANLHWQLILQHCATPDNCHQHYITEVDGASGSFIGPDHEYPSYVELRLTATDSSGLSTTVTRRVDPKTVNLTFNSVPAGLNVTVGSITGVTPFTQTVIQKSTQTVSAPTPQTLSGTSYAFDSWSNGGAATQVITAPTTNTTYTANYTATGGGTCSDSFGYVCTTQTKTFTSADTVLSLTGDEGTQQITLPFAIKLYGQSYTTAWVDTNGLVSFVNPNGAATWQNGTLPNSAAPNATVYAFHDDLVVDANASVRTTTLGSAPNRQFVIEWRNPYIYGNTSRRITFEAILSENGDVITNYSSLDNDFEKGSSATVGIENADGSVGLAYSVNTPKLQSGRAVVFTAPGGGGTTDPPPPSTGAISGTVSVEGGGAVSGATVTLTPGTGSTTSGAGGAYAFSDLAYGTYTVTASYNGQSVSTSATLSSSSKTVNLTVPAAPPPPEPGSYAMTTLTTPFVAADTTVLALTGDDNIAQVTLPAPVKLYGQTYSTAWIDTNGKISFVNPGTTYVEHSALPSTAVPNATVYPFWDDLVVDASASVRMATVDGSVVIEWRNPYIYGNGVHNRITFSVAFAPDGTITMYYSGLDNDVEKGSGATVGVENATGTAAVQYLFNQALLASGKAVRFTPS
ncbi:PQQ-dependent sugar dehydrogenase [Dactylosporangium sp. AC04546]|uniref:PQQ-dependent sugar dehydrogenase n=1 Tax=Dactylosporangium sp. AC04546 TaxID=2862460 RepID=UPI001EE0A7E0|nr:PQQ-dependent sugar dehydrogenase [Dactylosporangium sp. AC04546]WVK83267.1 PQQ-dependent sugar dehydrogenase [Dactylosporangium sp. AC04546]